jgi:hypothetical protein
MAQSHLKPNPRKTIPYLIRKQDMTGRPTMNSIGEYTRLLPPSLNRYILTLPIKTPSSIPLHIQIEITHHSEMNDKIFNIDANMWDIARNVIEPISFHRFHRRSNPTIFI